MKKKIYLGWFAVAFLITVFSAGNFAYASDYTGKTIIDVKIAGEQTVPANSIMAVVRIKPGNLFDPEKIHQDLQSIYEMGDIYNVTANFTDVPEGVKVTYVVTENPVLKNVVFKGNTKVSMDQLKSVITLSKGRAINTKTWNENARAIEQDYHNKGYILAKVSDLAMDPDGTLTVSINEGTVEGIVIKGNEKTKPYVITREMKLKAGEPFNAGDAKRSLQKIYNLGFFEDVNMKLNPGREPNAVVPEVDVKEQKTGNFLIGGGYSQTDGFGVYYGIGDSNFKGTGNKVNLTFQHGISSEAGTGWDFSYTNPWMDDKQTSFSVDLFNSVNEWNDYGYDGSSTTLRSDYYRRSKGFSLSLGRPQGEYVRYNIKFTNRKDTYQEYISGPVNYLTDTDYSDYLKNNFGIVHSMTLSRVYDTRDNIFDPTEGKRVFLSSEFAGNVFGGQFDYNKYTLQASQYFKVGSKQTLALATTAGYATGNVPDISKFYVGGIDTLRGYKDEEFTGKEMFTATIEYRYPIVKKVEGVLFTDAGNAWEGDYSVGGLKYDIGAGVLVNTPIGPIRLYMAYGDEGIRYQFGFGGQF
ncbi:surface antigen variable number [Lucifera butyrica]|uniref:Surface antigen variable number n=1 Tax=Lucifera butyrica TaxID=1351585 RepID=A0A498RC44_9FIRM|nr:BamA/TamA family outer membrane protein [Lucifera butyrica]VBB06718.1 surface antigen variable number [Lucifera butyrica]